LNFVVGPKPFRGALSSIQEKKEAQSRTDASAGRNGCRLKRRQAHQEGKRNMGTNRTARAVVVMAERGLNRKANGTFRHHIEEQPFVKGRVMQGKKSAVFGVIFRRLPA
jgi:hypothetical protein